MQRDARHLGSKSYLIQMEFVRGQDLTAYASIRSTEIFLRKIVRWELRGHFGRAWYLQLGEVTSDLEDRLSKEKRDNLYSGDPSILSYLMLYDLLNLIFTKHWNKIFSCIFSNKKYHRNNEFKDFVGVRNKVGHFRPISDSDIGKLASVKRLLDEVSIKYTNLKSSVYIPGAFGSIDEQIDNDGVDALIAELEHIGHRGIWDIFQQWDAMRSSGLSPGIGIVNHHIFYEFYTKGAFNGNRLIPYILSSDSEITFMNIGKRSHFVRIFIPVATDAKEMRKLVRKFSKAVDSDNSNTINDSNDTKVNFNVGNYESISVDSINTYTGFIF